MNAKQNFDEHEQNQHNGHRRIDVYNSRPLKIQFVLRHEPELLT